MWGSGLLGRQMQCFENSEHGMNLERLLLLELETPPSSCSLQTNLVSLQLSTQGIGLL